MRDSNEDTISVHEIIRHYGGCTGLATALNIHPSAVSQWQKNGFIPDLRCHQIEIVSKGHFKAKKIRKK